MIFLGGYAVTDIYQMQSEYIVPYGNISTIKPAIAYIHSNLL